MPNAKAKNGGNRRHQRSGEKWVQNVKTVSTFPPESIFTKDAKTIAKAMESKKVSPKGLGSGIRMIQYFINRAGKNLSATRKKELEKAKRLLQEKRREQRSSSASAGTKSHSARSRGSSA
jgi:tRNA(adenine34) deaminase